MHDHQRTDADPPPSGRTVRATVPLDVDSHVRLCAVAALRGVDRGALAASLIREGLKGLITIIDKQKPRARGRGKSAESVEAGDPVDGIGDEAA